MARSPLAARFPLHMVSTQPGDKLHAQMDAAAKADAAKSPAATSCGCTRRRACAQLVRRQRRTRLQRPRATLAGLRISDDIIAGVVRLPTGTWFDPATNGERLDKHGNPNAVTQDIAHPASAKAAPPKLPRGSRRLRGRSAPVTAFELPF